MLEKPTFYPFLPTFDLLSGFPENLLLTYFFRILIFRGFGACSRFVASQNWGKFAGMCLGTFPESSSATTEKIPEMVTALPRFLKYGQTMTRKRMFAGILSRIAAATAVRGSSRSGYHRASRFDLGKFQHRLKVAKHRPNLAKRWLNIG